MKKLGTEKEKKRVVPPSSKKAATNKDVFQLFAEKVRENKKLESRWAILQETRVEYFRGKDFPPFLNNNPELKDPLGSDKDLEVEDVVNTLLRKNLLVRCDRVVKTVRPGKKKLSSWPAHLEIYPRKISRTHVNGKGRLEQAIEREPHAEEIEVQVFSEHDAFFAWTFMKRGAPWQTILSFLWPLVALAICLFPVYPYQWKIVVLYSCAGALLFIVTVLLLRGAIFGALYVILGKRIWFFPNINVEETTFRELIRFWPKKDEGEPPKWTSRLTYSTVAVLVILLLRHHAPDEAARARYQKKVSNIIDDVLEWSPKLALSGMMDKREAVVVNASEAGDYGANSAESSADKSTEFGPNGGDDGDTDGDESDLI